MTSRRREVSKGVRSRVGRFAVGASRSLLRRVEERPFQRVEDFVAVFVVPWPRAVTGGYVSILQLLDETHRIGLALGFDTHACDVPGEHSGARIPSIANSWTLTSIAEVSDAYRDARTVWIHVPSHMDDQFVRGLLDWRAMFSPTSRVIVNILNQHIQMCPSPEALLALRRAGVEVTMTTAHKVYATLDWARHFGVPLHHISTWLSRERYAFARRAPKDDRVIFSNDNLAANDEVIASLPSGVQHRRIHDMTYDQYLRVLFRSKWSVTFGEGLDAYFIEMAMSGGVPLAVFNEHFFTPDFADLPNVFPGPVRLVRQAPRLIAEMRADPSLLDDINRRTMERLDAQYDIGDHRDRLTRFYLGDYDFVP